ncbi:MAG: histidine kinase, partial [Bacteroidales bacterium]|nr:histidine kinase [Bacteroidales bacterium]
MKRLNLILIITIFAVLHSIAAAFCYSMGIEDEILLTMLTMAMTIVICTRYRIKVEFTALSLVLVNIVGYILGIGFGQIIEHFISGSAIAPATASFITTGLLGSALAWFTNKFKRSLEDDLKNPLSRQTTWLAAALVGIFSLRLFVTFLFNNKLNDEGTMFDAIMDFSSDTLVLLMMILATIIFVRMNKGIEGRVKRTIAYSTTIIGCSIAGALAVGFNIPYSISFDVSYSRLLELFVIAVIIEIALYSLTFMADYTVTIPRTIELERNKANLAKYQYLNLKQQLNPHFLFNSLNILDALIKDGMNDEASTYVHKLAGLYRYMLNDEADPAVQLRDEMDFVNMYVDLLKVRFEEGLQVEVDIPDEDMQKVVIPCSVQLLIENATKHNGVSEERPLQISIKSDGEKITVTNNLCPKVS